MNMQAIKNTKKNEKFFEKDVLNVNLLICIYFTNRFNEVHLFVNRSKKIQRLDNVAHS
jgi:hypothetical protein